MKNNINWEKFYERFKWEIEDSRPYRCKIKDENIPSKYYTLELDNDKRFDNPVYTECYERCMYKSEYSVHPEEYGNTGNCTCDEVIGYNVKYKPLKEMKVKDCYIILNRIHHKNVEEYLTSVKMPFGKFKGKTISDIIESGISDDWETLHYLFWLWRQGWCKGELQKALDVVRLEYNHKWDDYINPRSYGGCGDPYDSFSLYREVGYGDLC